MQVSENISFTDLQKLILNSMMRAKLGEVMKYIHDTCDKEKLVDGQGSDADEIDEDIYGQLPRRSEALTSPPQSRPITATATAQSSAALHNVISPSRSTVTQRAAGSTVHNVDEDMMNSTVLDQQARLGNNTAADMSSPRQQ